MFTAFASLCALTALAGFVATVRVRDWPFAALYLSLFAVHLWLIIRTL